MTQPSPQPEIGTITRDLMKRTDPHYSNRAGDIIAFEADLAKLINYYSLESASGTPDFILASYLVKCLTSYNLLAQQKAAYEND